MTRIFTATLGTETNTFSSLPTGLQLVARAFDENKLLMSVCMRSL